MLIKIYIGLLALCVVTMGFLTLYSSSWLGSIGSPASAVAGYEYRAGWSWLVLWISAALLLLMANSILWVTGRLWPMWTTLLYFQIFVILRAFWLDPALLNFKNNAGMTDSTFTVAPLMAALLVIISASIVFFDQFLILRLREKTYGLPSASEDLVRDVVRDEPEKEEPLA